MENTQNNQAQESNLEISISNLETCLYDRKGELYGWRGSAIINGKTYTGDFALLEEYPISPDGEIGESVDWRFYL